MVSSIYTAWAAVYHYVTVKQITDLRNRQIRELQVRDTAYILGQEMILFSATNTSLDPILREFELKSVPTNSPAAPK